MAENPPPEFFLAAYFRGHGWWQPQISSRPMAEDALSKPSMTVEEFAAWERSFEATDQVS